MVAGIPTGRIRDRLVPMATNTRLAGVAVAVAVDPYYTSRWALSGRISLLAIRNVTSAGSTFERLRNMQPALAFVTRGNTAPSGLVTKRQILDGVIGRPHFSDA